MSEINLLPKSGKHVSQTNIPLVVFRFSSLGLLVLTCLTAVILFILKVESPLTKLKEQENTLRSNLSSATDKFTKYILLQDRLKAVETIIAKRPDYYTVIDDFLASASSDISITQLSVSGKNMLLSGSSSSLTSINTFLDKVKEGRSKKKLVSFILEALALDVTSNKYIFTVRMQLP